MEERGEVFSGTTIKDTWTKPRRGWKQGREVGMVGVWGSGGGVNADNCTSTTIK